MSVPIVRPRSLSAVVAAWNGPKLLRACLKSLAIARARGEFEVIVAVPAGRGFEELITLEFPWAAAVTVAAAPTVPALRKAGLTRATGELVAFLEDHATVVPEWAEALLAEYALGDRDAVGGPVAQAAGRSSVDWAAYLFDYGRFMPPRPGGPVRDLSGLNMSFSRPILDSMGAVFDDGVFEGPLYAELVRRGTTPYLSPSAIVIQNREYPRRQTLLSFFYLGRGYAGRRIEKTRWAARLVRAATCVALPAVLLWRILSTVLPKGQDTGRVLRSLGYLSLITISWSIGEFVGYVAGSGDSDSRWR